MLMSPNKGETAVHGCHCPGDMVVRMRTVLAIPRGWYVCLSADKCWLLIASLYLCIYLFGSLRASSLGGGGREGERGSESLYAGYLFGGIGDAGGYHC